MTQPVQVDDLDECEACGETAVCITYTLRDGDLIADMLICYPCRLSLVMGNMRRATADRVAQLQGIYHER